MKITKNFALEEFKCKDGTPVPDILLPNITELCHNLQELRDVVKKPITINSGFRTASYNAKIGGVSRSQHVIGRAADITVEGMTPDEVADLIEELIAKGEMKQGGVGRYNTFTHYDIRGRKARWDFRK